MAIYPDSVDYTTWPPQNSLNYQGSVYVGGGADLDASWTPISGPRAVLEHVARRLISPPGSYDDPTYGFDINTWLNASLLSQELSAFQAAVRYAIIGGNSPVEGVENLTVQATLDAVEGLVVGVTVVLADQDNYTLVFVLSSGTIPLVYFPA